MASPEARKQNKQIFNRKLAGHQARHIRRGTGHRILEFPPCNPRCVRRGEFENPQTNACGNNRRAAEHQKKRSSNRISIEDLPEKSILQPRRRMLDMMLKISKNEKK